MKVYMNKADKIVIVGGGSSGWMAATQLNKFFPKKEIVCIESKDIPRVGVGESTVEQFSAWVKSVGIDTYDMFTHTDATYKLSIKFNNFYKKDDGGFHYPFGMANADSKIFGEIGLDAWQYMKLLDPSIPNDDYAKTYFPTVALCEHNTINFNNNREFDNNFNFYHSYAYHFDAIKFANFLRDKIAVPRGVKYIPATVEEVNMNDRGIESVTLDSGEIIEGDLFLDCTGFKSLLLSKLDPEWLDYGHIIPNNRAWACRVPYTDIRKQMDIYTNCTALGNGWVWNTPTRERIGTGYVYSDKYTTPEAALKEFQEHLEAKGYDTHELKFREVHMRVGMHREIWKKNCVAIGLAAGFIEPLESTGLFTTVSFIQRLTETLHQTDSYHKWQVNEFNTMTRGDYDGLAKFTASHYMFTQRTDTQYWRDCMDRDYNLSIVPTDISMPETQSSDDYWVQQILRKTHYSNSYDNEGGIHCIMAGMNSNPLNMQTAWRRSYYRTGPTIKELKYKIPNIREVADRRKKHWNDVAEFSESHYDYLRRTYWS